MSSISDVPVFPLPDLIVMPGTEVGLHFFEPRYRAMAQAMLEGGRQLVLAPLDPADRSKPPRLPGVATLARVLAHEANPDGTIDVMFEVEGRVRIDAELAPSGLPYRRVRCTPLDEPAPAQAAALAARLGVWVRAFARVERELGGGAPPLDASLAPGALADRLADRYLRSDPATRRAVLNTVDIEERVSLVETALSDLHATLRAAKGPSGTTLN